MARQDTADRDGRRRSSGDSGELGIVVAPVIEGLSVGKTLQHQGIEAYRQAQHTLLDTFGEGESVPEAALADHHAFVDRQGQALHDAVDEGWAQYGRLLADTATVAGAGIQLSGWTDEASAPFRVSGDDAGTDTDELQAVEGIGSTYASRLREAGIGSLEALAQAEPHIADDIDAIGVDVEEWIDEAAALTETR